MATGSARQSRILSPVQASQFPRRWCQSNANLSPIAREPRRSWRELALFGQRGGTVLLKDFPRDEMSVEVEMVEDRGMGRSEFLQCLDIPES